MFHPIFADQLNAVWFLSAKKKCKSLFDVSRAIRLAEYERLSFIFDSFSSDF
jgi:hypothetical protein